MNAAEALLAAWEAWDASPGAEHLAVALVKGDRDYAQEIGTRTNWLRDLLSTLRRTGFDRDEALQRATDVLRGHA